MIDLDQMVVTRWNNYTKKHFQSLGYILTYIGDQFQVRAGDLQKNSTVMVKVICDCCGIEYDKKYSEYNRISENNNGKYYCKSCATRKRNLIINPKEKFFNKFIEFCNRNNYIPLSTINDYKTAKSRLRYICPIHGEKTIAVDEINDSNVGCRECSYEIISEKNRMNIDEVIKIINGNGNELLNPEDYISVKDNNLMIKCGICGNAFKTSLASQMACNGACLNCGHLNTAKKLMLTKDDLNRIYNSGDNIVLLNPDEYQGNDVINLKFICRECGKIFIASKSNYDAGQTRCKRCAKSMTSGEETINLFLKKNNVNFIFQKRFKDCVDKKPLPFDFYLSDINTCIEFDGPHHFEPVFGIERFEITQLHDKIKTEYCMNNNIKLIRIPYWESKNIEHILFELLNNS